MECHVPAQRTASSYLYCLQLMLAAVSYPGHLFLNLEEDYTWSTTTTTYTATIAIAASTSPSLSKH